MPHLLQAMVSIHNFTFPAPLSKMLQFQPQTFSAIYHCTLKKEFLYENYGILSQIHSLTILYYLYFI